MKECASRGRPPIELGVVDVLTDLKDNIEDLDPEYSKVIDDNFWELATEDTPNPSTDNPGSE